MTKRFVDFIVANGLVEGVDFVVDGKQVEATTGEADEKLKRLSDEYRATTASRTP